MSEKIISIRFLNFEGFSNKRFAFAQMGISLVNPWKHAGLLFSKHLGVGAGNGFSVWPDFSMYVFLGVFESQKASDDFFETNARWSALKNQSSEMNGWDTVAIKGHGTWNGNNPFEMGADPGNGPVLVLTRASIVWYKSLLFWFNVSHASKYLSSKSGLLFAKGVGEFPLLEQATLSLWESEEILNQFAYKSKEHAPMIKKTRALKWYSEEMFIRMRVLNTIKNWDGVNPSTTLTYYLTYLIASIPLVLVLILIASWTS